MALSNVRQYHFLSKARKTSQGRSCKVYCDRRLQHEMSGQPDGSVVMS